jgi:hypothetical protein
MQTYDYEDAYVPSNTSLILRERNMLIYTYPQKIYNDILTPHLVVHMSNKGIESQYNTPMFVW